MENDRQANIPIIERTFRVRLPNGTEAEINRFDLNANRLADIDGEWDRYVQLTDGAWIRHRLLTVIG